MTKLNVFKASKKYQLIDTFNDIFVLNRYVLTWNQGETRNQIRVQKKLVKSVNKYFLMANSQQSTMYLFTSLIKKIVTKNYLKLGKPVCVFKWLIASMA